MGQNGKSDNKCQSCGTAELTYIQGLWKLAWPLWREIWHYLEKSKVYIPVNRTIPHLGPFPPKSHKKTRTRKFRANFMVTEKLKTIQKSQV